MMKVNKENIELAVITAIVTLIVSGVGIIMFNTYAALFSGIASGLSVTVGKEYGDSLIVNNRWHWSDIIPGVAGVVIGIIAGIILYHIM